MVATPDNSGYHTPNPGATPPLFSIITVTFNARAELQRTMQSVDEQGFPYYEHIIVDGASTDGTVDLPDIYSNPRRRFFSEPDNGVYDAMNKGLAEASGSYVIFLNAGDRFHSPDTTHSLYKAIMNHDFPGVVYGQTDIVDAQGKRLSDRHLTAPSTLTYSSFADGMVVCHQAFVALRKLTQPYDLAYRFSADYDWCLRILQHSRRNVYVDEVLIDYLSEGLTTRNHGASLKERFNIMCRYYGVMPTLLRHVWFAFRYLKRKLKGSFSN